MIALQFRPPNESAALLIRAEGQLRDARAGLWDAYHVPGFQPTATVPREPVQHGGHDRKAVASAHYLDVEARRRMAVSVSGQEGAQN